jgi:hypothetical protein
VGPIETHRGADSGEGFGRPVAMRMDMSNDRRLFIGRMANTTPSSPGTAGADVNVLVQYSGRARVPYDFLSLASSMGPGVAATGTPVDDE